MKYFYVTNVPCFTARQTQTSYAKFIKFCRIEYLTTQIKLVLPTFKSRTVQKKL